MKKILSLVLALALILSISAALADPTVINGKDNRNITINKAGLNPSADEMIANFISPTTGRELDRIERPDDAMGVTFSGMYTPVMVQVSNAGGGVGETSKGEPATAPIGMEYADIIYEALQAKTAQGGSLTRFSAVYSDVIPYYVGFVRSTRLTHIRLRQEWNCAYCTSGYAEAYVKPEIKMLGAKNPEAAKPGDPGLIYVGDFPKVWAKYVKRLAPAGDANSELFELANIMKYIYPNYYEMDPESTEYKQYAPYNHTFRFTDEVPAGDSAVIVDINFGGGVKTDSILEYDEATNTYLRYVPVANEKPVEFRTQHMVNPHDGKHNGKEMIIADAKEWGEQLAFTNVIVQAITMNWKGYEQPDPVLTGTGNADYFIGGKHFSGVWERESMNSRTVFYGEDGNEISLMRGKTLIILMDYSENGCGVSYE